jgi:hypothetical protein
LGDLGVGFWGFGGTWVCCSLNKGAGAKGDEPAGVL